MKLHNLAIVELSLFLHEFSSLAWTLRYFMSNFGQILFIVALKKVWLFFWKFIKARQGKDRLQTKSVISHTQLRPNSRLGNHILKIQDFQ